MSDVRNMMLEDSKDLLDNVEVTTVAEECVKLKQKEDEIAALEEQLKSKKLEADDISSRVIPELLAEQGLSEIKLADGSKVAVKKEFTRLSQGRLFTCCRRSCNNWYLYCNSK